MYAITDWEEVKRVAPAGAEYFRYRRATGERRKFYESGTAFPLAPEELADRKPAHSDGVFCVCFYTKEEAQKPAKDARPMVIQPPDLDELMVEFPKGYKPGDSSETLIIRELLNSQQSLAKSASAPIDATLKLLEKVSHERDLMAEEAEKNRIGPVWQLILEHHPQIKDLLIAAVPVVAAIAKAAAERLSNGGDVGSALAELRRAQEAEQALLKEHLAKASRSLTDITREVAKLKAQQSTTKRLPAARKKLARAAK